MATEAWVQSDGVSQNGFGLFQQYITVNGVTSQSDLTGDALRAGQSAFGIGIVALIFSFFAFIVSGVRIIQSDKSYYHITILVSLIISSLLFYIGSIVYAVIFPFQSYTGIESLAYGYSFILYILGGVFLTISTVIQCFNSPLGLNTSAPLADINPA